MAVKTPGEVYPAKPRRLTRDDYPHGDAIWEHKKGKVWKLVEKLERENYGLRYQNRMLQRQLRRARVD